MHRVIRFGMLAAAVAASLSVVPASAQATIGELLDAGGKRLGKDELRTLLSGATYRGVTRFGARFTVHSDTDGSFRGVSERDGKPFAGRWWVEDGGLYCTELRGGRHGGETSCSTWFRQGARYFASDADAQRGAPLRRRDIVVRAAPASPHASGPAGAMRQSPA